MSLLDHLRPKWQSTDAEVRAQAVRELDKDQVELLTAVAQQDQDVKVRRIAVKKLDSPRTLLSIAESDPDSRLRSFAKKRACQLLVQIACDERDVEESKRALALLDQASDRISVLERAHFPELRAAALESITLEEDLFELVKRTKDPDLRAGALERIADPNVLKRVVLEESTGELAFAAVSRIEDSSTLESIYDQHALPKAIRRHALAKLEKLVPADHPIKVKERQERFLDLCLKAEFLVGAREASELDSLRRSWAEVESDGSAEPSLLERYRSAVDELEAVAASVRKREESEKREPEPPPADDSRLTEILERLASCEDEALSTALDEASSAWQAALADGRNPGRELESRFRTALSAASSRRDRLVDVRNRREEGLAAVEAAEKASQQAELAGALRAVERIERQLNRLSAGEPAAFEDLSGRLRLAKERVSSRQTEAKRERDEAERKTLEELEARTARLESLATVSDLSIKDAEREMREAQEFLKTMGRLPRDVNRKKARAGLAEAREKLFKRTQDTRELDEWKRWANVDVQQSLIERIEKLQSSNDVPKIAKELRAIHEEWKRAGAATADKADELWNKYKSIRDELKTRCDSFFEKQAAERTENLKAKELLCEQVEALKDSSDWRDTAETIKDLQNQWKKTGPVPKASSEAVWNRFRAACDHFFDRRKGVFDQAKSERDANWKRKVELCERAEELQSSTSWHEVADELKRLQSQWREIGAVPRKKSDAIWNRFRTACDFFFERYKRRDQVETEERIKRREVLAQELESMGSDSSAASASRVQEIWVEWKKLGPPNEVSKELGARFEAAVAAVVLASPGDFAGGELDPEASKRKREKLCERLETMVGELDVDESKAPGLEELAQRLKDALASNTMTGGKRPPPKLDWRGVSDEVARLRSSWLRTAPVPGDEGRALAERFDRALQSFEELRPSGRSPAHAEEASATR